MKTIPTIEESGSIFNELTLQYIHDKCEGVPEHLQQEYVRKTLTQDRATVKEVLLERVEEEAWVSGTEKVVDLDDIEAIIEELL